MNLNISKRFSASSATSDRSANDLVEESGLTLTGNVTSGTGRANEFLSLPGYVAQFVERLGYEPFPGTLNLELAGTATRTQFTTFSSIRIDEWEMDDQTFGGADCYPCKVGTAANRFYINSHILIPDRTHHEDATLEIVAPVKLRDILRIDDGNMLLVKVRSEV